MARSIDQIIASRKALYDPQRALLAQQRSALPGEEQSALAGLDAAKSNAFRDITASANTRGMAFSGVPIDEQSRYIGERFLPARAQVASEFAGRRSKLDELMLGINQDEMTSAEKLRNDEIGNEQDAIYKAQQLAMQRERQTAKEPKAVTGYGIRRNADSRGGLAFHGPNGRPISIGAYYDAIGGTIGDIVRTLSTSGNPDDRKIAEDLQINQPSEAEVKRKYPWLFQ